jgi:uncharacterized protein YbjT (DUF2867 family)
MIETPIFLTGATGYVGGRLGVRLIQSGYRLRCLVRNPRRLQARQWPNTEIVEANTDNVGELASAMRGCEVAYYLIHSMREAGGRFEERDRRLALNFAFAAQESGTIRRIIYLGGLGSAEAGRSPHLTSRQEVGDCLRATGIPVTEFRAAVVVGSGSASFELIRATVERLPVILCPPEASTACQPIAIRDVLRYLSGALVVQESEGEILEIGSPDVLSYMDMLRIYAEVRGLRRFIRSVPFIRPWMAARVASIVSPLPLELVEPLMEGLGSEVVVRDHRAREMFGFEPISYRRAVELAVERHRLLDVETSWFDAYNLASEDRSPADLSVHDGMIVERRSTVAKATPEVVWQQIVTMGGDKGWPYADFLWDLRGMLDRLIGGPGTRRGRRHPVDLFIGDALDFWRVEAIQPGSLLRLRAEMKVPGTAWLQFEVRQISTGTKIILTAFFDPHGLLGYLYWYAFYIPHLFIFPGMVRSLARSAEMATQSADSPA